MPDARIINVRIPYVPRVWADNFHASLERFLSLVLHRRAGKTTAILNHHIRAATDDGWERVRLKHLAPDLSAKDLDELIKPPGGRHYGHVMPTRVQAKLVAWDKLKYYASPVEGGKPNESELLYKFPNGNKLQLFGADDPDALRGPAFSGLSFDEYSQQPSNIFSEVLSKALGEHLGYAIFAGTIKGKDHLYKTWAAASKSKDWFALWQDVGQSLKTETGVTIRLLAQAMDDDRKLVAQGLMSQEEFDQEWFLSLEAAIKGAYFAPQLAQARKDGRICAVPYDSDHPVFTAWDLGYTDDAVIWYYQNVGNEIHVIDYYSESGGAIEIAQGDGVVPGSLTRDVMSKPYRYARHWLPHDAKAKTLASNGKSIVEQLSRYLGVGTLSIVPSLSVQDGIQAARSVLGRCWFDGGKCEQGLNALLHYKRKFDNRSDSYAKQPEHSWASHSADAFRMLAIAERRETAPDPPEKNRMPPSIHEITLDELWEWHEERQMEVKRI